MKIQKKQTGFTLIELITVVSMLALLTIFIAREMGQSSDDIKKNLVITTLVNSFPAAIASYKAANFGNCVGSTNTGADDSTVTDLNLGQLIDRGVPAFSPWGLAWSFTSFTPTTREVEISYSLVGANDGDQMATDIVALLQNNAVFTQPPTGSTNPSVTGSVITAIYSC